MLEDKCRVGAAKAEGIGQHHAQIDIFTTFSEDWHVFEVGIEFEDIGAFANEAVPHHDQGKDAFLHAGRADRLSTF